MSEEEGEPGEEKEIRKEKEMNKDKEIKKGMEKFVEKKKETSAIKLMKLPPRIRLAQ